MFGLDGLGKKGIARLAVRSALAAGMVCGTAAAAADPGRNFGIHGFAQTDYIQDMGGRLDPAWDNAFRPSKIGIDGHFGDDGQSSISVKQSRFGVKGTMPTTDGGNAINFKFEFDLFGVGVDAGQTTFRPRHAYSEWGSLLAGQTDSLFMDGMAVPHGPARQERRWRRHHRRLARQVRHRSDLAAAQCGRQQCQGAEGHRGGVERSRRQPVCRDAGGDEEVATRR